MSILEQLKRHEGYSQFMYLCPSGYTTIGYGFNLEAGMPEHIASLILREQVVEIHKQLLNKYTWYKDLSKPRQDVLINMAFNLGIAGLNKFKRMLFAISINNHEAVVNEMLDSKWAHQVKQRAWELADQWREDKYKEGA